MKNQRRDLFMGALIGSAIGAVAALILTPLSGDKLRGRIRSYLRGAKGIAISRFEEIVKASPGGKKKSQPAQASRTNRGKKAPAKRQKATKGTQGRVLNATHP